ncbi:hypothetical protein V7152_27680 [Neobacillus drentensis]|uniref:hypothetical protein n=1 Tax=Neobacillus drentensis TaxID=220684 RepID=UPI002FFFE4CE
MKKIKLLLSLTAFLIFAAGIIFYFHYGTPWDLISTKNKYQTYLEEKYKKTFVIDEISYDVFHERYYAFAHAKDEPEIIFNIGPGLIKTDILDSYQVETWNHQINIEWEPIVKKLYPDNSGFNIEVVDFDHKIADSPIIPHYNDVAIVGIGISVDQIMITDENRQRELNRAFKFTKFVKETRVKFSYFQLSFKNKIVQIPPEEFKSVDDVTDLEKWLVEYK